MFGILTMYRLRIKDPKRSLEFYEFLGMNLINKLPMPDSKFDLYFLAYDSPKAASHGKHWTDREVCDDCIRFLSHTD